MQARVTEFDIDIDEDPDHNPDPPRRRSSSKDRMLARAWRVYELLKHTTPDPHDDGEDDW